MERKTRPEWLRVKLSNSGSYKKVEGILEELNLNTVCKEANCPNRGECYSSGTATFMIMGRNCTRNCRFCNVTNKEPTPLDKDEPQNIGRAVRELGLKYIVVTSVTRDDLEDGGASHFASTINEIKRVGEAEVEVLIPDMKGNYEALKTIANAKPNIINHNIETVPRLYSEVRPEADYKQSLELIDRVKEIDNTLGTKSGIMLGLGETREEVVEVLKDLRRYRCEYLSIGQYLRPSKDHYPVKEYITPEEFSWYEKKARELGFIGVASGPLVRSSYHARELYRGGKDENSTL